MKLRTIPCTIALGLAIACGTGGALADQSIYSCTGADGSVELTSQPTSDKCEQLVAGPDPVVATAAQAGLDAVAAAKSASGAVAARPTPLAGAASSDAKSDVDPRAKYRDNMILGTQNSDGVPVQSANPSVSRRYLMTNRAAFQKALLDGQQP
jgi:hypothetical protein